MFLDPGSGMGKTQDPGSGINIPDPQHCFWPTLKNWTFWEMFGMLQVTMTESSDSWVMLGAEGGTISAF